MNEAETEDQPARKVHPFIGRTPPTPADESNLTEHVRTYYEATWYDFRSLWMNSTTRALHFGYWDGEVRRHADAVLRMNRELADRAEVAPEDLCLDAGSGVGGTAMWMAANRSARVVALTIVPDQAHRTQEYAGERELASRIHPVIGDFGAAGLRPGTFDVIYSQEAVCHASDKRQVLEELATLLRPGGRIVLAEFFDTGRTATAKDRRLMQTWLDGWSMPPLPQADEFVDWAQSFGLDDAGIDDITPAVERSLRRLFRLSASLFPIETVLHRLGLRNRVQHGNVTGSIAQWQAVQRRLWLYGLFSARKPPA